MSRQPRRSGSNRSRQRGWLSFLTGLAMGLFVAFLVYLQSLTNVKDARQDFKQGAESAPQNPVSKPKFDFYTILPEMEVKVPEWEVDAPPLPAPQSKPPQAPPDTPYLIQVGSFQRFQEADKMKARLALIGISADIQRVTISGTDVWFRVRVGPFKDLKKLQSTRSRLAENSINFMLVRMRPGESAGG